MPSVKKPKRDRVPEIVRTREGVPYLFVARPGEVAEAMAEIPDEVFLETYARCWRDHEKPPLRTAGEIRRRALVIHIERVKLLRERSTLNRAGRLAAERRLQRWHIVPNRLQPDPRIAESS